MVDGTYCCHNPSCGAHGDFITFYRRVRNLQFQDAVNELAQRCGLAPIDSGQTYYAPARDFDTLYYRNTVSLNAYHAPDVQTPVPATPANLVIDEEIVRSNHAHLLASEESLQWLNERRGISRETVERFQLGWDGQRYYIPIRDEDGQCVNIRRYKPARGATDTRRGADKVISWRVGFGTARLWPLDALTNETIYLVEGEMDCILAIQLGVPAMTTTGGAGTWRSEWASVFRGKHVVVCYDNDDAGHAGATQIGRALLDVAASVKSVIWPLNEPAGFDFTDYIQTTGHSVAEFYTLVEATDPFQPPAVAYTTPDPDPENIPLEGLANAGRAENNEKLFRINVTISGIASTPSIAPIKTQMYCGSAMGSIPTLCPGCPLRPGVGNGAMNLTLEHTGNKVLNYHKVNDSIVLKYLKAAAGIPAKCPRVTERRQLSINLLESAVMPDVAGEEMHQSSYSTAKGYVTRTAYQLIGEGKSFLYANHSYCATMRTVANPKTQDIQHIITSAVESQADVDVFQMSDQLRDALRVFSPDRLDSVDALVAKAAQIHEDLENVTRTYERRDLMMATDLTYLSPIGFTFQGDQVVRGWVECLVIGDSRTGKTQCVHRMLMHYGAGEFATGENTSFAGLVAGLTELNSTWFTRWGKIPLNDRRLLVIDEAGNMPQDQIARMSALRSSGVAEIVKIHTERTRARTRQIWMANPRGNQPLSGYSHGVLAVKELIGAPEDIARFDLVVTAAATDVDMSVINADRSGRKPQIFTSKLCNQRVMWAWSRRPELDQIVFTPEATQEILRLATIHGNQYRFATRIPLVEPNEQRIKLARLSAAAAAFFFCASPDGQVVVVRPEHVVYVYDFLNHLYAKPSLAYASYAETETKRFELHLLDETIQTLRRSGNSAQALMEQEQLTQTDLMEVLGIDDRARLRATVTQLKTAGFLRRVGTSYYVKTPAAITWLREEIRTGHRSNGNGVSSNGNGASPPASLLERSTDHARTVESWYDDDSDDTEPPW